MPRVDHESLGDASDATKWSATARGSTFAPIAREQLVKIKERSPSREGRSKKIWKVENGLCVVELKPTLRSFTFAREETLPGTEVLRLDFFEKVCSILSKAKLPHAFCYRIDQRTYVSLFCEEPPIEVIVKNYAVGSTQTLYPGLFANGHTFLAPVVKFDFRIEPQDLPLPEDYLRELGLPGEMFREIARGVNTALRPALPEFTIVDFCLVYGRAVDGAWYITSEISPDSMRIRDAAGDSYDKDIFRRGESDHLLKARWQFLVDKIRGPV